jgi:VanZ family protein
LTRLLMLAFWGAVAATLYLTLRPVMVSVPTSDKTQHLVTFGMLTLLAAGAYPRARLLPLALALSGLGAAIEFIQPMFERDGDIKDWVADSAGILIALALVLVVRWFSKR